MNDKRFIEESFPVKEVSEESAKEKSIRHGHISTLHIWWARRPLASSRATNYAALISAPKDDTERDKKKKFIIDLCKWENSNNRHFIERARKDILEANGGKPPKVLDPFAGGGAIPLEALRLGCETFAGEYNPVANLILKCTLEYPQKYGKLKDTNKDWNFLRESTNNPMVEDIRKWRDWIFEEVKKEIGKFYPSDPDGSIPVGYIWARTIPCQNPSCQEEIPLMRQFWLAKRDKKKVALRPSIEKGRIEFKIEKDPKFNPSDGTVKGAIAKCLICGSTVDSKTTRKLFLKGKSRQRLIAVILRHPENTGKTYRIANEEDIDLYLESERFLKKKRQKLLDEWGIDPVPDENIPLMSGTFNVPIYGITEWGSLFNSRQKLALIAFSDMVRKAHKRMLFQGYEYEYAKTLASYLALGVDRLADYNSVICVWHNSKELLAHTFGRQALGMVWDYVEVNPFSRSTGNWNGSFEYLLRAVKHSSQSNSYSATVTQCSATSLPYPDNYFDAVFTDPPYYNSVPYADLSDFFYVWLKRTIVGDLYADLFSTPLTPKSKEIVEMAGWDSSRYANKDKKFFEDNLRNSFQEIYRVLKSSGIATIVYTHKSTSGWETLINSLLDSNLVITASWPLHTEMKARLRAKESAALASSIYFVVRKMKRMEKGWYKEVKEEIKKYIYNKLERLWEEGISGADFLIAGIGSAIEIFGKYEKVLDYEGNVIRADKLLNYVRDVVADYAVRQILHNGIAGELSPLTKFYILWRWTYKGAKAHFDDARKLAQSSGLDISREWNKGFVKKEKEFIKVLGPQDRSFKDEKIPKELIDTLHHAVNLWKEGKRQQMNKILQESGWGAKDSLYRVAQAISSTIPQESKEKKLLDGFLSGKKQILSEVSKVKQKQLDLFIKKGRE